MKINSKTCPGCGQNTVHGRGHGSCFGFSYEYCYECDRFLHWDTFGMTFEDRETTQRWLRSSLLDNRLKPSPA